MFLPCRAQAAEVWFAPTDNLARAGKLFNQDFPHLFDEPPAWNTDIDVFQIAPFYAEHATDEDLLRVARFLSRRHIVLGAAVQPMQIDGECAGGEGRTRRGANLRIFRRLRALGLDIQYIGLDEPLTFGHYASRGARPCQLPIDDVARRVAATISEIRESYPLARIVDYEAPTIASVATWPVELAEWLDAYKRATGANLDAVAFDVDWRIRWLEWVRPGIEVLHSKGVHAGMLLTIAGPGTSDAGAVASLKANIQAAEEAWQPLDLMIVACWTPYPSLSLPASASDTLTSVLDWYLSRHGRGAR
jgi:hypothetical protein